MLSLIELQNRKVEAKRKKYEQPEMDAYLELVFDNYKGLIEENKRLEAEKAELNKKIKTLSDGVQYYRSIETTLQKALILAEKTSKETKDAAILKAESIEKEAHKRADIIVKRAEDEYNDIRNKSIRLVQQFNQYKLQLREAASAQLQLVDGDEFDISKPDELDKALETDTKKDIAPTESKSEEVTKPTVAEPKVEESVVSKPKIVEPVVSKPEVIEPKVAETIQPEVIKPIVQEEKQEDISTLDTSAEEILTADTIDLGSTLDAVKTETDEVAAAEVKTATLVEPVAAKPVEPMDITFGEELAADKEKKQETIEPQPKEKNGGNTVPTLDALLQDLNINNKNNQKSDDPFEFLGSVDDF